MQKRELICCSCSNITTNTVVCEKCNCQNYCSKECLEKDRENHLEMCRELLKMGISYPTIEEGVPKDRDDFDRKLIHQFLDRLIDEDELSKTRKKMIYIFLAETNRDIKIIKVNSSVPEEILNLSKLAGKDCNKLVNDYFKSCPKGTLPCLTAVAKDNHIIFHPTTIL